MPNTRYPKLCYNLLFYYDGLGFRNWVTSVRENLYRNDFGHIWEIQFVGYVKMFLCMYSYSSTYQCLQMWRTRCIENRKLPLYVYYKTNGSVK